MAISINTPANFASNNVKCTPVSADIIESVSLENPKRKKVYMLVKNDIEKQNAFCDGTGASTSLKQYKVESILFDTSQKLRNYWEIEGKLI